MPTLADIRQCYGTQAAVAWLGTQLQSISEFSGAKAKLTPRQTDDTAMAFLTRYYYLKVTEFLLFFFRFKCGDYGLFYGAVDPMVMLSAFRTFLRERGQLIDDAESARRAAERNRREPNAMTYGQWRSYKPFHEAGYSLSAWRAYRAQLGSLWGQPYA